MQIALITDGITPFVTGGMQRHSYHLAKRMLKQGVQLTLVHTVPDGSEIPNENDVFRVLDASKEQLEVVFIPFRKKNDLPGHYVRESYVYSCDVYEALKGRWAEFDFIYAKGYTSWCLLEKKKKGEHMAPVGVKLHGYEMFQKTKNLKTRLEQYMLKPPVVFINRNADLVFSYGGEITAIIERMNVPSDKIIEIGSGIDDGWLKERPSTFKPPIRFLFIGRNERRKGIGELVAASDAVDASQAEFHWVGPIPEKQKASGANHFYHGEIKDAEKLKEIIDACQVLVTPSYSEGMPNVILEAMSRGLAVIATEVGAVPKMVSSANGILIPPADTAALALALTTFVKMDEAKLAEFQNESLRKVKRHFLWDEVGSTTIEAIKRATFTQK